MSDAVEKAREALLPAISLSAPQPTRGLKSCRYPSHLQMTQSQKAPPSEPGPQSELIIVGRVALTVVVTVVPIMVVTGMLLEVAIGVRTGVGLQGV